MSPGPMWDRADDPHAAHTRKISAGLARRGHAAYRAGGKAAADDRLALGHRPAGAVACAPSPLGAGAGTRELDSGHPVRLLPHRQGHLGRPRPLACMGAPPPGALDLTDRDAHQGHSRAERPAAETGGAGAVRGDLASGGRGTPGAAAIRSVRPPGPPLHGP